MPQAAPIEFVVAGTLQAEVPEASLRGSVRASVQVGTQRDGGATTVRLQATPGEDVVVLSLVGGPSLVLHPASARDLMRAQGRTRGTADAVDVPAQLGWPELERAAIGGPGAQRGGGGWMGRVLLRAFSVVRMPAPDEAAADLAAALVTRRLDGRVEAGLYRLDRDRLEPLKDSGRRVDRLPPAEGPLLVLVHGTFVDTVSTFGKLWSLHPDAVARLFDRYGGRVYALDHPTLGASPASNALTLVRALPEGAVLHLLTHSRGGLVAEVLARAAEGPGADAGALADFDRADPARAAQREELLALAAEARARRIRVERVVRVACPARGTLLASGRLDAYLSVLRWGLELAQVPILPELVDFLHEVARRRADPAQLPGLEAMRPESPWVRWLNRADAPLAGTLHVVAGDVDGDGVRSWLKTLLADAFYWTDNDLVVQTRSMYGGTPRGGAAGAGFVLERGGDVTHFTYFSRERSVRAIVDALCGQTGAFRPIGPRAWAGEDAEGTRAARAVARSRGPGDDGRPADTRPAVVVIPGILGSHLARDGRRIWLAPRFVDGLDDLAWRPEEADRIRPDGLIGSVYDALIEHLAASHAVIPFPFDWRRPIEDEARRLGAVIDAALRERDASGAPVRIVAHSLGGLVARTVQLECPDVWQRMMARGGARLLMLGTPNGGSWAPMQTLTGDDPFGNAIAAFGVLFDDARARRVMAAMPGFLQLQAGLLDQGLDRAEQWARLADEDVKRLEARNFWHTDERQLAVYRWSAPPQPVLDAAVALRRRLDAQWQAPLPGVQNVLLVTGRAPFTPDGFRMGDEGLAYLDAPDAGDGRVTRASACLPGVRTWQHDVSHGDLPSKPAAFDAYLELLELGDTQKLPRLSAPQRGEAAAPPAAAPQPNRPSRRPRSVEPPSFADDLYATPESGAAPLPSAAAALPITVVNGNIKFVGDALMLGHYASTGLAGSEYRVNRLIGGAMAEALRLGRYPDAVGDAQVFANVRRDPDEPLLPPQPGAVIVVGLGEEGRLRVADLAQTVCQGVLAQAQRAREQGGGTGFPLATTLIGSGGTGMRAGSSAQAIAQGVAEANRRLAEAGWPVVSRLAIVELFLDRATEAHHALAALAESRPREFLLAPEVDCRSGALRAPRDSGYRGANYDFVTAVQYYDANHLPFIEYTLDTQRARSEVRGQATQSALVDALVHTGSASNALDARIGQSLFQLLVPVEIRPFLSGSHAIVLQLDPHTARIPWEMLDVGDDASEPWAVRTRVVRKLRTERFRESPAAAGRDGGVLVIGEPQVDPARFAELPGARAEAQAVADALPGSVLKLQPDALVTVQALLERPLRVLHIAGHGVYREDGSGGVVLSGQAVLGAREVQAMARVPDLVFVNCCHLGRIDASPDAPARNALGDARARFAANLAEELIRIGVRCVVAAGWAVEDEPARLFAERFYEQLLAGVPFIDAVGAARRAAWLARRAGNTWAAYQCYGDPDWTLQDGPGGTGRDDAAVVSPAALQLALEMLSHEARYADRNDDDTQDRAACNARIDALRRLEGRHRGLGSQGAVAEAFANGYRDCGEPAAAIDWYRRAIAAPDAGASLRALEQLANLLVRREPASGEAIAEAIGLLQRLLQIEPTVQRHSLLGSAHKRAAALRAACGDGAGERAELVEAGSCYRRAEELARAQGAPGVHYPLSNRLAIAVRLALLAGEPPAIGDADIDEACSRMRAAADARPEFWPIVGLVEMRLLQAVVHDRLAAAEAGLIAAFADLRERVRAPRSWSSVAFQARFVLEPALVRSDDAGAAARRLLALLEGYAAG